MIIGDKNNFAIEYIICKTKPHLMGKFCLWVNNIYIGDKDEEVMLLSVNHYLKIRMSQLYVLENDIIKEMPPSKVYEYIYNEKYNHTRYLLNLGESFDDFSTIIYLVNDCINFIWKIYEDSAYKYPDYPIGINSASVDLDEFSNIVNQFSSAIDSIGTKEN